MGAPLTTEEPAHDVPGWRARELRPATPVDGPRKGVAASLAAWIRQASTRASFGAMSVE